jgi:CheY-like chemotaxis protein
MSMSERMIVLAENDDDARALVADTLRRLGFAVLEARDGNELLEHVKRLRDGGRTVALVLSDISMPGCDGIEATRRLIDANPGQRVLLMTAFGDQATLQRATQAGAFAILRKPFSLGSLEELVLRQ